MASRASVYYPRRRDFQILGLNQILAIKNGQIFRQVLLWGTPRRQPGQPFSEYLLTTKGLPENELRKRFNKGQRDKMDNDPQMTSFDVSLIYQCLKCGTDGLAPPNDDRWKKEMDTLEGRLTSAKNYRNDFVHGDYVIDDQLFLSKIEEIRKLLTAIVNLAARHFGRDQTEVDSLLKDFNEELNKIRDLPFNTSASSLIFDQLCTLLRIEGRIELEENYKAESSMSPVSNLLGRRILVNIKNIYTKIEIHGVNIQVLLEVNKLFEYVNSLSSRKNLLLVEGVAGAGKTTLIRLILHEWSKRSSQMKNLDNYDLAIWTECRDGGTPSLAHLLQALMPNATQKIQGDAQVVKCIQKNELLFLVDGLDELNASSERVFREILALKDTDIITIICTTRPNKVPDIKRYVPDTFEILHVKIIGIAEEDREDFVRNYCQALGSQIGSTDISGLIHFLMRRESRLQEHWRLPFNLVLVTILWFLDPDIVNGMTTATELFMKTYELCKERLIQRLHNNEATSRLSSNDIRENLNLFVKVMSKIAFASHFNDETVLSETSLQRLKEACHHKALPPEEVMSSFLVQAVSLNNKKLEKYSFPHKGLQDFFCALHIEQTLEHEDTHLNIPRIISSFEQILLDNMVPEVMIPSFLQVCKSGFEKIQGEASTTCHTVRSVLEEALKRVALTNPNQTVQLRSSKHRKVLFHLKTFFSLRGQSLTENTATNQVLEYDLRKWRNILVHLTGLLHHRGRSLTDERAEEMVKLLKKSGIDDSNEWFDFLSNVKCDEAISKHIVLKGDIEVTDARVEAFLKVLAHAEPGKVKIYIKGDPSTIPGLQELLVALREKDWKVWLYLHHDFRFPKKGGSILDGTLRDLFRSNLRLRRFQGQLSASALKELPSSVSRLWLSVKDGAQFRSVISVFTGQVDRLRMEKSLTELWIHVPVDIDESSLRPLPREPFLRLFMSGVGEATVEKASGVARALLPSGKWYFELRFPGVGRTPITCERLLQELGRRGVEIGGFGGVVVSPSMEGGEAPRARELAKRKLGCGFLTKAEDDIWKMYYPW